MLLQDEIQHAFTLGPVCLLSFCSSQNKHANRNDLTWWILKGVCKELGRQCDLAVNGKEVPKPTDSFKVPSLGALWGRNFAFFPFKCGASQ